MIEIFINNKLKPINVKEKLEDTNAGLVFRVKLLMDLYVDFHLIERDSSCNNDIKVYDLYRQLGDDEVLIYTKGILDECIFIIENEIKEMIFSI